MGYFMPANAPISASWQDHKNRNPPSSEPGTDVATAYGTVVNSAAAGTISFVDTNAGGGEGRTVGITLDDGRYVRYLHLDTISVSHGQRVGPNQKVGISGASGYGDNWYYGPHVHVSLWERPGMPFNQTIDFMNYVGSTPLEPKQRRVLSSAPANGRSDPSTANPPTQSLPPGTVANMDGWIHGEAVSGNNMWFHGAISGDWFWSGGFDGGADPSNLTDMNTPNMAPTQRQATTVVNGRAEPNTTSAVVTVLDAGAVGDFNGWINGQSVEGENRWLRGAHSGAFFSLKYLKEQNTDGLPDLNAPVSSNTRTVAEVDVNLRGGPYLTFPVTGSLAPNAVVTMNGWAHGEDVQGIDIWYRVASSSLWGWAGGFTSQSTEGLDEITSTPEPPNPNNPRGLPEYEPVNPGATIGLEAPLGFDAVTGEPMSRDFCGSEPTTAVIDRAIIHHTATTNDQLDYFSYRNDRSSCPTWYVRPTGERIELIRPGIKPASTGSDWNCRSVAWEVLDETGAPNWLIPENARRAVAEDIAWLAEFDGKELDGVPVAFAIDAEHVIGHNQAVPGTECPGPDMDIPGIIAMAQAIWDENHPTDPCPECPECPDPSDDVEVSRVQLEEWQSEALSTYEEIGTLLEGEDANARSARSR